MSKKFHLLMIVVLVTGLLGGLMTASTVSADPTPGLVIEIPRIDKGNVFAVDPAPAAEDLWQTKIQVQNVGGGSGGAIAFFWPEWDGTCPSNDPGPCGHACMQLPYNGVWTLRSQIPACAKSAIIYSVDWGLFQAACAAAALDDTTEEWKEWVGAYAWTGPELAVTVDRWGSDPYDEYEISSSYTGIADDEGAMTGQTSKYFAPYVMHNYNNLDTTITIMNSGEWCTSCWIYYKKQGFCEQMKAQHIEALAPGQAIRIGPGKDADMKFPTPEVGSNWLGSAYITCNNPMAIIIDQLSNEVGVSTNLGTLLSMRGMPYDPWIAQEVEGARKTWFADLLYREISGWDSSIQVQNMTQRSLPTFVTVEFFDQSGDSIFYLGDWVCRNGTATFYLPAIIDLGVNFPFGYVGAAEIESHYQIDYPGGGHEGEDIVAVVDIKKRKIWDAGEKEWRHTFPGETQGGAYNAHPLDQKVNAWGWAMPYIAKEQEGVTSRIVVRNNSNCTKIRGRIYIKDETGFDPVAVIPVAWLQPKHMKVIDLNYFGQVYPGFVGAAEFFVEGVEQLCDLDGNGETDILPVMPSVVVLNYGFAKELPSGGGAGPITARAGDLTRVYEAIPFAFGPSPCVFTVSGHVIDMVTLEPINGATVNDGADTTDSTGYFQFNVDSNAWGIEFGLTVTKSGYNPWSSDLTPLFCDDVVINPELDPECEFVAVSGTVYDKETGETIEDAWVTVTVGEVVLEGSATGFGSGEYKFDSVPFDPNETIKVCAGKIDPATGWVEYTPHCLTTYIPECGGTATMDFELHTEPWSRILLYWGNGGSVPDGTESGEHDEYYLLQDHYEAAGYIVNYTNAWPADPDLGEYKMVVLLVPGLESDLLPDNGFTEAQVTQMGLLIARGGRVVLITDDEDAFGAGDGFDVGDYAVQNDLLDRLSIGINITDTWQTEITYLRDITGAAYQAEFTPEHLEGGDGFVQLELDDDAFQLYENNDPVTVIAGDKVGQPNVPNTADESTGWDVIVIGDEVLLSDARLGGGWLENDLFADQLISFPTAGP